MYIPTMWNFGNSFQFLSYLGIGIYCTTVDHSVLRSLMQEELKVFVKWNLLGPAEFKKIGGLKVSYAELKKVIEETLPKTPEAKDAVTVSGFPRTMMNHLQKHGERISK